MTQTHTHEEEEQALSILASFKDRDELDSSADHSCCNEDPDQGGFHAVLDGIYAGLGRSKKEVWSIQLYDPGETTGDFSTGLFYFYIDTSYENVKKRIAELPSLLSAEEIAALEPQVKALIPAATVVRQADDLRRGLTVVISYDHYQKIGWEGLKKLPQKIGDVRLFFTAENRPQPAERPRDRERKRAQERRIEAGLERQRRIANKKGNG